MPTDEAYTRAGTPARTTASITARLPSTLVLRSTRWSWLGWICQARCTTASAPANTSASCPAAPGAPMSQECHSTWSYGSPASGPGNRRTTPASSTPRSRRSRRSTAVPTLPLAPTTTIRMPDPVPAQQQLNHPPERTVCPACPAVLIHSTS